MSLNHRELADVLAELPGLLTGALLRKLNAPRDKTCQLVFRTGGADRVLFIDLNSGRTRLHLLSGKLSAPPRPPAWVMKGRQEIEGARLKSITCAPGDRIVTLEFAGDPRRAGRLLVAELFGRRGRLLLLDPDRRLILALVGSGKPKELYQPPPARGPAPQAGSRFPGPDPDRLAANRAVEARYQESGPEDRLGQAQKALSRLVAREHKKLARLLAKLESDLAHTAEGQSLSRQGEALKINLGKVKKGQEEATLDDPYQPGQAISVGLDPARSPVENMKRIFQKARRMANARPKIQGRIDETRDALDRLDGFKSRIEDASSEEELATLEPELRRAGIRVPRERPAKKKPRRLPYRLYRSRSGKEILVGKSGRDNHELTFKVARGSDMWFHAQHTAGAHVIVRLNRNESIDEQTLLDAASLAAGGSRMKNDEKVEVTYTEAKNVHPIKGAKPGQVSVARSRSILVRLEPQRMQRLHNSLEE